MKYAILYDGKLYIADERWITINADPDEPGHGQHVLIKENGDIVFGLGGKFRNLRDLGGNKQGGSLARDYNCELAQKIGKDHYDAIHDKIDACGNEKFKEFYGLVEKNIRVDDANYKGRAHEWAGQICVNIKEDSVDSFYEKAYQTTMHESGHAIDHNLLGRNYASVTYKNGLFGQTIVDEVNEHINLKHLEAKMKMGSRESIQEKNKWLYENGYLSTNDVWAYKKAERLNKLDELPPFKYSKKMAYKAFATEVVKGRKAKETFYLSDILAGATKNKIGSGHSAKYWRDQDFSRGKNAGVALEAFANITSSIATNKESLDTIKKFLPRSYKVYEEILDEAIKMRKKGAK